MVRVDKHHTISRETQYCMLKDIDEIFKKYNLSWALFMGTMLGAVRDGDIAEGDYDLDIMLLVGDEEYCEPLIYAEAEKEFLARGYKLQTAGWWPRTLSLGEEWIDIWLFKFTANENRYYCAGLPFPWIFFKEMQPCTIRGIRTKVVNYAEEFLDLCYGTSWRVPLKYGGRVLDNVRLYKKLMEYKENTALDEKGGGDQPRETLTKLIRQYMPKDFFSFVEVGIWTGYTAEYLLKSFPTMYYIGIDPWVIFSACRSLDELAKAEELARKRISVYPNTLILKIASGEVTTWAAVDNTIDMVFIDGCHDYVCVKSDIENWWPKTKTILCGHDSDAASVKQALDEFCEKNYLSYEVGKNQVWWIVK